MVENELLSLQPAYEKKLIAESDDPENTKSLLKTEIMKWREYRDAKCDLYGSGEGGTSGWKNTWSVMCKVSDTKSRIAQIRMDLKGK